MFGLSAATKVYLAVEAVDMRKSFEGLYGLVRDWLEADPKSGFVVFQHVPGDDDELVGEGHKRSKTGER